MKAARREVQQVYGADVMGVRGPQVSSGVHVSGCFPPVRNWHHDATGQHMRAPCSLLTHQQAQTTTGLLTKGPRLRAPCFPANN